MFREPISVQNTDKADSLNLLPELLGTGEGRRAVRSAPLSSGKPAYWFAGARILKTCGKISEAVLFLYRSGEEPRRLAAVEEGLIGETLKNADDVLDAVKALVDCKDDSDGSAAVKSFLAGWICADVVGRCLNDSVRSGAD